MIGLAFQLLAASIGAPLPGPDGEESKALSGNWVLIGREFSGGTVDYKHSNTHGPANLFVIDLAKNRIEHRTKTPEKVRVYEVKRIAAGQIDLIGRENYPKELQGKVLEGIYSLKGDTLKICYCTVPLDWVDPPLKRPTEFKAPENSYMMVYILKKEKK